MTISHGQGSRIKCGGCGSEGRALFGDAENTLYSRNGSGRRVMAVQSGFRSTLDASIGIACEACGSGDVWAA